MKNLSLTICVLAMFCSFVTDVCVAQDSVSSASIQKVKSFMNSRTTGRYVLGFLHMGADHTSHTLQSTTGVKDHSGRALPGEFALVYNFTWNANGRGDTKVAFFFDRNGNFDSLTVMSSTGYVNSPFTFADATIQVLGQGLVEAFQGHMSASERRQIQALISSANSEGLLELGLKLRQSTGIR